VDLYSNENNIEMKTVDRISDYYLKRCRLTASIYSWLLLTGVTFVPW